jgi:hypothetical protein
MFGATLRQVRLYVAVLIALTAAGAGWAQSSSQREARLLIGPMTERPIAVTCSNVVVEACKDRARAACADRCNGTSDQDVRTCAVCRLESADRCMSSCK